MVRKVAQKVSHWLRNNVVFISILVVLIFLLGIVYRRVPESSSLKIVLGILFGILGIVFAVIAIIFPFVLIRKGLKYLFNAKNLISLIIGYLIVTLVIIYLFSQLYAIGNDFNVGYLTRGECYDTFNKEMKFQDSFVSHNYLYLSAITFFTVGYGDICPMGLDKDLSIINALIGHIFTTIILVIAISSFLEKREEKK